MNLEREILKVLDSKDYISDFNYDKNKKIYKGIKYNYIFKFILTVESHSFNMILAIPQNWNKFLMDVYFEEVDKIPFIPHLEKRGNICLFDTEGALIEFNFSLLLNDVLNRMYKIVDEGLREINKEDYIIEFSAYWGKLPNALTIHADVELKEEIKEVVVMESEKGTKKYFVSDKNRRFEFERLVKFENKTVNNGVYIYIDSDENVYPPDWRVPLKIKYINKLLAHKSIDKKTIGKLLKKRTQSIILIFNIKQPSGITSLFGVELENYKVNKDKLEIKARNIYPIYVERWDDEYLVNRGGGMSKFKDKKIFIIGCGSIGGYLINELVKTGFENLTFTDYDNLSKENIYRHVLGLPFLGINKARAMENFVTHSILHMGNKINYYEKQIENLLEEDNNLFSRYDLIISAVGNHNLNRWLNKYMYENKINTPIIYGWNEALGIGSHAALIDRRYSGCYECFFDIDENNKFVYDKTSFSERGQVFSKKMQGCFSSYIPFGSVTSITTVLAIIEITKRHFENRIDDNILKSSKGDSYYMEKEGYLLSPKYKTQENKEKEYLGLKFNNMKCEVCKNEDQ